MPSEPTSKSAVPPVQPGHRRRISPEGEREIAGHYAQHGYKATIARYGVNSAFLKKLKARYTTVKPKPNGNGAHAPRQTYLLARKLKEAVSERLRTGHDLGDVEIYATLLTRQLLE